MSAVTKIIKTTIGNVIFAFSIGIPLTVLTFWAAGYAREFNPYLIPILFGGIWLLCDYFKMGSLTLFIYIFYTFLFIRNKYYGSVAILCIHNIPLAIAALFMNYPHGVPQSQSFFKLMNPVYNLYALPTILLYFAYNLFLLFHIFRNFYVKSDGDSNIANNLLYYNRYSVIKYGCIATVLVVVLTWFISLCYVWLLYHNNVLFK